MPTNLAAATQLAAEITLRANTGPGADEASADFRRVGDSAGMAAKTVERTSEITEGAGRAYQRLQRFIDPLATAQQRLVRDQETVRRAFEQGAISADRQARDLEALQRQFDRTRRRIEETERAQEGLNREVDRFGVVANAAKGAAIGFITAFSFREITQGAREAVSELDRLAKASRSLGGIDQAGFLQSGTFALGQLGIDDGGRFLAEFNRRTAQTLAGRGEGVGLLRELEGGEALIGQLRNAQSLEEQFALVVDRLNEIDDAQQRILVGNAFFGEELGNRIGALAEAGAGGFTALTEEARAAGLVIDQELLVKAEELNDRFSKASQIIDVQLKQAFLDIAPIVLEIAEAAARFAASLARAREGDRLRRADLGGASLDELGEIQKQAEIDAEAARRALDAQRRVGPQLGGSLGDNSEIRRLSRELAEAERRASEAARVFGEGLAAQLDSVGDLGAALEGARRETAGAADESARAADNLDRAAKAAQAVRIDPIELLDLDIERLQALVEAARVGPEELDAAERRFEIEDRIARLKVDAARAGAQIDEDAARDRLTQIDALSAELEALTRGPRARQGADDLGDELSRSLANASDRFWDDFVQTGRFSFRDLGRDLKSIFLDALIAPLRDFTRQIFANVLSGAPRGGGFAGGAGVFTPGINGASPVGGGGFAGGFNLLALAPQLGLLAGAAAIPGGQNTLLTQFGASFALSQLGQTSGGQQAISQLLGPLFGRTFTKEALGNAFGFNPLASLGGLLGGFGAQSLTGGPTTGGAIGAGLGGVGGQAVGTLIGGPIGGIIGNALGSFLGGSIGGAFARRTATGRLDLNTLQQVGFANSGTSDRRNQIRDDILNAVGPSVTALADILGGSIPDDVQLRVSVNGDRILTQFETAAGAVLGEAQTFGPGDVDAAKAGALIDAIDTLITGADELLVDVTKSLLQGGASIETIAERISKLSAVLADPDEIVDPLRDQIDAIIDAFEGLDRSSGALADAFEETVNRLAEQVEREARRFIEQQDNPQLAAINEILRAQDARRVELERLGELGGNVDAALIEEFFRRQLLGQFNSEDRFAQAVDPVRFALDQLVENQEKERAAFLRAIEGSNGVLTQADFLGLLRAQEAERFNAFRGLSDEDRARLSGRSGEFDDLTNQYTLAVERLIFESNRLAESFEAERQRLEQVIAARASEEASLTNAIFQLDQRAGLGTPRANIDFLRTGLEDLRQRALFGDTEEIRSSARAALPDAVNNFVNRVEEVFASGEARANAINFGRDLLVEVRDQAGLERSNAEKQLDELERARLINEEVRDILAAQRLDSAALLNAVSTLSQDNPLRVQSEELVDLERRQLEQQERFVEILSQIFPADVGLTGPSPDATSGAPVAPSGASVFAIAPAANDGGPAATSGQSPGSFEEQIFFGLESMADEISGLRADIRSINERTLRGDEVREEYLRQMAGQRNAQLV